MTNNKELFICWLNNQSISNLIQIYQLLVLLPGFAGPLSLDDLRMELKKILELNNNYELDKSKSK